VAACGPTEVDTTLGAGGGESFDNPYDVVRTQIAQTDDVTIAPSLSVACSDANGTSENSWYRMFALSDYGVVGKLSINRVNFGVQTVIGYDQRVKVSVGTYAGSAGSVELDPTKIDVLGLTTISVPEGSDGQMLQANFPAIEVSEGSNLVVEIKTEGFTDGRFFYLGATTGSETMPGYLRAPSCGIQKPRMTSAFGYSQSHLVIAVSGSY
jgi:hypothetical protein